MAHVRTWDFTCWGAESGGQDAIIHDLRAGTNAFAFQLERGEESGELHWQGRIRLRAKKRLGQVSTLFPILEKAHWSPTANANSRSFDYVLKTDTRVEGPWTDKDTPQERKIKTREIRDIESKGLLPWQKPVVEACEDARKSGMGDPRWINVIWDIRGNSGKSALVTYLAYHGLAFDMPPCLTIKDLMSFAIDNPSTAYCIDLPRNMGKSHKALTEFWMGVERIKDGKPFDPRYKGRWATRERPEVIIFTNAFPDLRCATRDRWRVFVPWETELHLLSEDEMQEEQDKLSSSKKRKRGTEHGPDDPDVPV